MLKFGRLMVLAASAALVSALPANAVTILWPKDNSVVRETVTVAVDKASVPEGSAVNFYLNNTFIASVGFPRAISGGRTAYVWVWDTREPVNLGGPNDTPKRPVDGTYEIGVRVVSSTGTVTDRASARVRLANQVTSIPASTPISLKYSYRQGLARRYRVTIAVSLADLGGAPVQTTQQVQSVTYTGVSSVEDMRGGGLALLRYYVLNPRFTMFGRSLGPLPGYDAGSIYQVEDDYGRVQATDLFSTAGVMTSPSLAVDCLTPLPRTRVRAGDEWGGAFGISLPALGDAAKVDAKMTLAGLEWVASRECASITSTFSGPANLNLLSSSQGGASESRAGIRAQIKGTSSDWFAFKSGELVRRELTADVATSLDQSIVQRFTEGLGISGPGQGSAPTARTPTGAPRSGPAAYDQPEEAVADINSGLSKALGLLRPRTPSAGPQGTPVKLRVRVSVRLID